MDRHDPRLLRPRAARAAARRRPRPALHGARRAGRPAARRARLRDARSRPGPRPAARRRSTSPPPTARRCATSSSPRTRRCAAAARPIRGCRSRRRSRRPIPRALAAARAAAAAAPRRRRATARRCAAAREALEALRAVAAPAPAARAVAGRRSTPPSSAAARRRSTTPACAALPRGVGGVPGGVRRPPRPGRADAARRPARPLRRRVRRRQGGARGGRLRRPRAARARPARRPGGARALGRAVRADHGRRVPGHEPAPARRARGARARQPVRGRRRVPVDLPLPPRRRDDLPRAPRHGSAPTACAGWRATSARARSCSTCSTRAFAPELGDARSRRSRGRERAPPDADGPLRLFDPDPVGRASPPVELLITDTRGWDEPSRRARPRRRSRTQPWRRAEARLVAHRLRAEVDDGRRARRHRRARARDGLAAAARAGARGAGPADLRRRRPRLLVAGAGPRRHRLPRRARQPARRGGAAGRARLAVLRRRAPTRSCCSRRPGARAAAARGRRCARPMPTGWTAALPDAERDALAAFARFFAAERPRAERAPAEVLLERAIVATGYDLAVLARSGGERRLANLRKLMRLAREYERAEGPRPARLPRLRRHPGPGRGARGRGGARVRGARRRAPDDDPPRQGARVPGRLRGRPRPRGRAAPRPRCCSAATARVGLRLAPIGGGEPVPALDWDRLADERAAGARPRRSGGCSTSR